MKKCQNRRNRETRTQNFLCRPTIVGGKFLGNSQLEQTPNFFKQMLQRLPIALTQIKIHLQFVQEGEKNLKICKMKLDKLHILCFKQKKLPKRYKTI